VTQGPARGGLTPCTSNLSYGENGRGSGGGGSLKSAPPAGPPEQNPAGAADAAAGSQLLIDQVLPTYDVGVVQAEVFRAAPASAT
jgi:hypothetical protein